MCHVSLLSPVLVSVIPLYKKHRRLNENASRATESTFHANIQLGSRNWALSGESCYMAGDDTMTCVMLTVEQA